MWNLSFSPPKIIEARVLTRMPDSLRKPIPSAWAQANKPGHVVDCFLEGPCFDAQGQLYVTDIPHGRIFRIDAQQQWHLVIEYDGWPNGMACHADGSLWIADYKRGILRLDPQTGTISPILSNRNSESFKGVNDLCFNAHGHLYFTDQGQTGLHDPTGRVYRYQPESDRLDPLLANGPSPNGLVVTPDGKTLFVAMTRGNQIWRSPILPDGSLSKAGAFQTFFGTSGPDGLALDAQGNLIVAHASLGGAFVLNPKGEVTHIIRSPAGSTVTNVSFQPGTSTLVLTESQSGSVLVADLAMMLLGRCLSAVS